MRGYIDTEFNGFGGELISMAIVLDNGNEWYQVKRLPLFVHPWVAENVVPVLGKESVDQDFFTASLHHFLSANFIMEIIADWPSDLEHFFRELLGQNHDQALRLAVSGRIVLNVDYVSAIPHNALEDARAIKAFLNQTPNPH